MSTQRSKILPSLRGGGGNAHGAVAAVHALHLHKSALLVRLLTEANEAVSARLTGHSVGHDLGRLARRETGLEERHEDELVDLGSEVANEDAILRAAIVAARSQMLPRMLAM